MNQNSESDRATMNGKPVKWIDSPAIINFDSGFAPKLLCDGLTFSMGTGCVYSCEYCYVNALMLKNDIKHGIKEAHRDVVIRRRTPLDLMRKQLTIKSDDREKQRRAKLVIYSSPLVDVAANVELMYETFDAVKLILEHTNWDIRLLSKSPLLWNLAQKLESDLASLSPKQRVIYGFSTGTPDDDQAKAIESDVPIVSNRLKALYKLQDAGHRTFGMICPSLPVKDFEEFADTMRKKLRPEAMEHVWAEVINARGESFDRTRDGLKRAGFKWEAAELERVRGGDEWEQYARDTFVAEQVAFGTKKLRYLQYVNANNKAWWSKQAGAVLLGKAAHG